MRFSQRFRELENRIAQLAGGGGGGVVVGSTSSVSIPGLPSITVLDGTLARRGYADAARFVSVHGQCIMNDLTSGGVTLYAQVIPPAALHAPDDPIDWAEVVGLAQNGVKDDNSGPRNREAFHLSFLVPAGWDYGFSGAGTAGAEIGITNVLETLL